MAQQFFNVYRGLELDDSVVYLTGAGQPGSSTDTSSAQIGSIYTDTAADANGLQIWWKHAIGSGTDKWSQGASTAFVAATAAGISWREPVVVSDVTSTTLPLIDVVDGITILAGQRVLFTALTTNPNVYIWSGTAWVEDTNLATPGDAVLIEKGTRADQQWIFDTNTGWFQFGGSTIAELDYVRAFVGKDTAGSNYPNYVSNNIVVDGQDLRLGISQLDDSLGNLVFSTHNVIADVIKGTLAVPPTASTLSTLTLTQVLNSIDATFGNGAITNTSASYPLTNSLQWGISGGITLTTALNELNNAIGNRSYSNGSTAGYVLQNAPVDTITAAIDVFNNAFGALSSSSAYTTSATNPVGGLLSTSAIAGNTVQQTFDQFNSELGTLVAQNFSSTTTSILPSTLTPLEATGSQLSTAVATEVVWLVQVKDATGNRLAFRVHALTDGTSVDYTPYALTKIGSIGSGALSAVGFDVNIVGGNFVPSLNPSIAAGTLSATIKRESYSYLA
jgi:hypothetical protein